MRAALLGLGVATVVFLALLFVAARITDSATDTLEATNRSWLVACALAGLVAGFVGDRAARRSPVVFARYAAAVVGPALLSLLFALTTSAQDEAGLWVALALSVAGAGLGAFTRERIAAQRRR